MRAVGIFLGRYFIWHYFCHTWSSFWQLCSIIYRTVIRANNVAHLEKEVLIYVGCSDSTYSGISLYLF